MCSLFKRFSLVFLTSERIDVVEQILPLHGLLVGVEFLSLLEVALGVLQHVHELVVIGGLQTTGTDVIVSLVELRSLVVLAEGPDLK